MHKSDFLLFYKNATELSKTKAGSTIYKLILILYLFVVKYFYFLRRQSVKIYFHAKKEAISPLFYISPL